MSERVLLISVNPFPLSMATLAHLAGTLSQDRVVDAFDAYSLITCQSPHYSSRDRLYEVMARKYRRFVATRISGRDITREIPLSAVPVPALPESVEDLRNATSHDAKVGLAALS